MKSNPKTTAPRLGLVLLVALLVGNQAGALKPKPSPAPKPPAATAPAKPPESLSYGRFGQVAIYRPAPHPKNVVLFLSGDGGWNLGVVDMGDFRTFVIADIPGLIEGAHEGHGLGDKFLRHVERTKLLLHLVDVSSASGRDAVSDYEVINRELEAYDPRLAERPQFVVATKIDALDEPARLESLRERAQQHGRPFFAISAVAGTGVRELLQAVARELDELRANMNSATSARTDESLLVGSGSGRF